MSNILVNTIKDTGNNTLLSSDGSGNISSGGAITNTPKFLAYLSSNQDQSDYVRTRIDLDTTTINTDSVFDTSTYKFTVPSGQAGTYFLHAQAGFGNADGNTDNLRDHYLYLYKNGDDIAMTNNNPNPNWFVATTQSLSLVVDLSVGDYIEMYSNINVGTGNARVVGAISGAIVSYLYGYKLIGA